MFMAAVLAEVSTWQEHIGVEERGAGEGQDMPCLRPINVKKDGMTMTGFINSFGGVGKSAPVLMTKN